MPIDSASSSRIAQAPAPASARGGQSGLSAFLYDWLFRGCERTFSPFHRGVVTAYALENGAAGDGDNRDHSLFAIRAARCSIHEILPISTHNQELELLFHLSVRPKQGDAMEAARVMLVQREQPPARQSSDIGSAPATFQSNVPAGIVSRDRAARETQELARASLKSDMALAEFKIHLDLAAAGKIDPAVQPIALYLFHKASCAITSACLRALAETLLC